MSGAEADAAARPEPVWLSGRLVRLLHAEAVALFGGAPGVRDEELLESALARPRHRWTYDEAVAPFDLAATYAVGLAKNHPFVDGNKRAALLAIRVFLFQNGYDFGPDEVETVTTMESVASGTVTEDLLARWIEAHAEPRAPSRPR